ncbi:MAG: redoxin domain-containing protein [Firmicutes bacterium]|nr:redoxin domain-containing protein [Bacillota bacterium]
MYEKYEELKKLDVEVLAVIVDGVFGHKMWNDNELSNMINKDISYPMLSDQDGSISKNTLKPGPDLVGNVWKEWKVEEAFED